MNLALSNKVTVDSVQRVFQEKGYPLKIGANYLNIFGIRANTGFTNTFDDLICMMYRGVDDKWILEKFEATTDPGTNSLLNPINAKGAGILAPGYYPKVWELGLHKGKYEAFVQRGMFKVYRDNDRDKVYDLDNSSIEQGEKFGLNGHHAGTHSQYVNDWSYACQVWAVLLEFQRAMSLAHIHQNIYINEKKFDYTLLLETDF